MSVMFTDRRGKGGGRRRSGEESKRGERELSQGSQAARGEFQKEHTIFSRELTYEID